MHEGFKGADLTFLGVEVELFEPAVDELGETGVLFLAGEEELVDLAVEHCPE